MRAFATLVAAFCMIGFAPPAQAIGMQFCDDIKDDHARMACLQEHISHLEQTIVVLAGRLAAVENALQKTIAADASYKLKSVAKGDCLGLGGEKNDQLALVSCDNPNSWTALSGAPIKKPTKTPAPADAGAAAGAVGPATPQAAAGDQPTPGAKTPNPCKGFQQTACAARANSCTWKADKNKCVKKDKQ